MVFVVTGEVQVIEGDETYVLRAGEAVTFKAGVAKGHYLTNVSDQEARYLVIGTRSMGDTVTYPDHDRILTFTRDPGATEVKTRHYTTLDGQPAHTPYED